MRLLYSRVEGTKPVAVEDRRSPQKSILGLFGWKNLGCQKGPKYFLQKFLHPFCRNFCTKNGLFRPQLSEASRGLKWSYELSVLLSSKRRLDVSDLNFSSKNIENSRFYARMSAAPVGTFWTTFWTISLRILGCFEKWYFSVLRSDFESFFLVNLVKNQNSDSWKFWKSVSSTQP